MGSIRLLVLRIILRGRVLTATVDQCALPIPKTLTRGKRELVSSTLPLPPHWSGKDHGGRQDESPSLPVLEERVCTSWTILGTQRECRAIPCGAVYA